MFGQYNLNDNSYNSTNAYLTMTACHFVFPASYHAAIGLPNNTPRQQQHREVIYEISARSFFISQGFTGVYPVSATRTGVNALVLTNDDYCMVVFRGTEMLGSEVFFKSDMAQNSRLGQSRGGVRYGGRGVKVHTGLATAARSVANRISGLLSRHGAGPGRRKPVIVTGHSLGGAMATITAFDLNRLRHNVQSVYSHAGYMVGNGAFADAYGRANIPYHRTVNKDDAVPEFPQNLLEMSSLIESFIAPGSGLQTKLVRQLNSVGQWFDIPVSLNSAYTHVPGTLAYINHNDHIRINPDYLEMREARRPGLNTTHHDTRLYRKALYKALPRRMKTLALRVLDLA